MSIIKVYLSVAGLILLFFSISLYDSIQKGFKSNTPIQMKFSDLNSIDKFVSEYVEIAGIPVSEYTVKSTTNRRMSSSTYIYCPLIENANDPVDRALVIIKSKREDYCNHSDKTKKYAYSGFAYKGFTDDDKNDAESQFKSKIKLSENTILLDLTTNPSMELSLFLYSVGIVNLILLGVFAYAYFSKK